MKILVLMLCGTFGAACAQQVGQPLANFTGTVRRITATDLTLSRPEQEDLDISCTHKTHYYSGSKRIKREQVKPGDRVSVDTKLDLYLKPEAVNVRVLPPAKQQ